MLDPVCPPVRRTWVAGGEGGGEPAQGSVTQTGHTRESDLFPLSELFPLSI